MDPIQVDYLAIILSAILFFVIMVVWYSKFFFGSTWSGGAEGRCCNFTTFLASNFVIGLIVAYFIAFFQAYLSVSTVVDGMFVGFCFWVGFVVPSQLLPLIWYKKSIRLFFIDTGAMLLAYLVMGGIIGA